MFGPAALLRKHLFYSYPGSLPAACFSSLAMFVAIMETFWLARKSCASYRCAFLLVVLSRNCRRCISDLGWHRSSEVHRPPSARHHFVYQTRYFQRGHNQDHGPSSEFTQLKSSRPYRCTSNAGYSFSLRRFWARLIEGTADHDTFSYRVAAISSIGIFAINYFRYFRSLVRCVV